MTLVTLLVLGGLIYAGLVAFVYLQQDRMVYFPSRTLDHTPADMGLAYEEVWLETADGVTIHGWFLPADAARGTVLFFHGNASNISTARYTAAFFQQQGLNVLSIDYRGYGLSAGRPSEQGTYQDALAAWRYLVDERGSAPDKIIIVGRSLGGGVASWLAHRHAPGGLILDSTFTSLPDVGAGHYPFLPVRQLSRYRYATSERLPDIRVPVLIAHSRDDRVVPFAHGQQLYAIANEPKTFLEVRGPHNGAFEFEQYAPHLRAFIDEVLPPEPASY